MTQTLDCGYLGDMNISLAQQLLFSRVEGQHCETALKQRIEKTSGTGVMRRSIKTVDGPMALHMA